MTDRVTIDGLPWCAECHRAVDRGWPHADGCTLAPATDEEMRNVPLNAATGYIKMTYRCSHVAHTMPGDAMFPRCPVCHPDPTWPTMRLAKDEPTLYRELTQTFAQAIAVAHEHPAWTLCTFTAGLSLGTFIGSIV